MTKYPRSIFAVLLAAALVACAQFPPPDGPSQAGGTARDDDSPRFIGVIGIRAQHAPAFLGVPETNFYCLRSFVDRRTGETQHQLYVSDSYFGAERHWNAARDGSGRPLHFIEIGRNEITCSSGCSYLEEFAANVPETDLQADPGGLTVIFTSRSGDEKPILVSHSQIAAQLASVEARRSPVQPASAVSAPQSPPAQR